MLTLKFRTGTLINPSTQNHQIDIGTVVFLLSNHLLCCLYCNLHAVINAWRLVIMSIKQGKTIDMFKLKIFDIT